MTDARSDVLDRIRAANGGATSILAAKAEYCIPRAYADGSSAARKQIVNLFQDRLVDYDATVLNTTPSELTAALAATFSRIGARSVGVAAGIERADLPDGLEYVEDRNLSALELDRIDAVLTRCTVAIAETGTLVLQGDRQQGRRALTLVPDTHVCIVDMSQVVATVPEAFAWLGPTATLPTTFVSGPSATADIEMTRIKGVHGPRFLHVILVDDTRVTNEPDKAHEDKR